MTGRGTANSAASNPEPQRRFCHHKRPAAANVVVAANALWEKAGGKVLENAPELEPEKRLDLSKLSLPELKFLLKIVRTCKVGAEVVPIGSGADVMDGEATP